MAIRYEPLHAIRQEPNGRFVTFAEHEELIREPAESIGDYFKQVESGELTAANAKKVVEVYVKTLMG